MTALGGSRTCGMCKRLAATGGNRYTCTRTRCSRTLYPAGFHTNAALCPWYKPGAFKHWRGSAAYKTWQQLQAIPARRRLTCSGYTFLVTVCQQLHVYLSKP